MSFTNTDETVLATDAMVANSAHAAPFSMFAFRAKQDKTASRKGLSITVCKIDAGDAAEFTGSYSAAADGEVEGIPVKLDKLFVKGFTIEDADGDKVEEARLMASKMKSVIKAAWNHVTSVITEANFTQKFEVLADDFDAEYLAKDLGAKATELAGDPKAVLNGTFHANVVGSLGANLTEDESKRSGVVGMYGGTEIARAALKDNGEALAGVYGDGNGILIANGLKQPDAKALAAGSTIFTSATDPVTGLQVGVRQFYDDDKGAMVCVAECLVGVAVGDPTALYRIVDTTP